MNQFADVAPAFRTGQPSGSNVRQRIVLFLFDFALSGVARNVVRAANALVDRGHDVTILTCHDHGRQPFQLNPYVRIHCLNIATGGPRGLALARSIPAMRRQLRSHRPDILVSAGNHGHAAALLASWRLPSMRRVLRISNEPDHPGDGPGLKLLRTVLLKVIAGAADHLLLVSPRLARHPALAAACDSGRATIVPTGVDVQEVRRLAAEPCDHPWAGGADPVLLTVGRLARQKNLPTLLRAVARANRIRPIKLLVVGGGSVAARAELAGLAGRLGIADRVDFVGEQPNPFPYMRIASALALPSLWEGRSNVLLEAMACGLPIVASRTAGDAEELLCFGRFGLLVDPRDDKGLSEAIAIQMGPDPCLPGSRAMDFELDESLSQICIALTGQLSSFREDLPDTPLAHVPA